MPAANIIQLRQLLQGRFPGLRTRLDEGPAPSRDFRPAALRPMEECLGVELAPGALAEIVAAQRGSGSALLLSALIREALRDNQLVALVDGCDSFDVTRFESFEFPWSRFLWVRCRSAEEALKAADLLLRDRNLPLVLLDLAANPAVQCRKIPPTTWYRFQRLVEHTSAVCVALTPRAMVAPARVRVELSSRFSLAALERDDAELLNELKSGLKISETRRAGHARESLQNTA